MFIVCKKEGVYIYYSLSDYNIPDCDYLFLKELRLIKSRAISFKSSVIKSNSNKKIRVNITQVYIKRII